MKRSYFDKLSTSGPMQLLMPESIKNPDHRKANLYEPAHFAKCLDSLMHEIERISDNGRKIQRVFWDTVPPVTIAPVARGVGGRMENGAGLPSPYGESLSIPWFKRYFKYYTRPWITDANFNPLDDPFLEGKDAITIDNYIMEYRNALIERVNLHNGNFGKTDWFVVDIRHLLERLAYRRYTEDQTVPPPPGWTPYEMPLPYQRLNLTTEFLGAQNGQRISGGLFSLDGVHPTTAGYGLVAQEFITVMQKAGVKFYYGNGKTERTGPVIVDYDRLLHLDSLIARLPSTMDDIWQRVVDGDQVLDLFKKAIRAIRGK